MKTKFMIISILLLEFISIGLFISFMISRNILNYSSLPLFVISILFVIISTVLRRSLYKEYGKVTFRKYRGGLVALCGLWSYSIFNNFNNVFTDPTLFKIIIYVFNIMIVVSLFFISYIDELKYYKFIYKDNWRRILLWTLKNIRL